MVIFAGDVEIGQLLAKLICVNLHVPAKKGASYFYQRLRLLLVKLGFLSPLLSFSSKIKPLS